MNNPKFLINFIILNNQQFIGIYIGKTSYDIKVSETQFTDNKANLYGGGIYATFLDSITLNKATFEKNIATDSGAGLYLQSV